MYYKLLSLDGAPLPTASQISSHQCTITDGGLLLEPPGSYPGARPGEGHAILRFFGRASFGYSGFIGASSESYRWLANNDLEISQVRGGQSSAFRGNLDGTTLVLEAVGDTNLLPPTTRLQLIAAPDVAIPDSWRGTLYYGTGLIGIARRPDAESEQKAMTAIEEYLAELEPRLRQEAEARLERAWRAPA